MHSDIIRERLEEGEKLLWCGTAQNGGSDETKAPEPAVKSMYGAVFKALLVPVALATVGFIVIFGRKAVMAVPFWIALVVLLFKYMQAEEWVYAVTDRRVLIGTVKSGIAAYSLDSVADISLFTDEKGIGCVKFTAGGNPCGFYGLENARQAHDILVNAKG